MPRSFLVKKREKKHSSRSWRKSYKDVDHRILPDLVYPTPVRVQSYNPRIPPVTVTVNNGYVSELVSHPHNRDQTSPALSVSSSHSLPLSVPSPATSYTSDTPIVYNSPSPVHISPIDFTSSSPNNYLQHTGVSTSSLYGLGMALVNPVCPEIGMTTSISPGTTIPSPARPYSPEYVIGISTKQNSHRDDNDNMLSSTETGSLMTLESSKSFRSMIPKLETMDSDTYRLTNLQQAAPFGGEESCPKRKAKIWSPVEEIMKGTKASDKKLHLHENVKREENISHSNNAAFTSPVLDVGADGTIDSDSISNASDKSGNNQTDPTTIEDGVTVDYTYEAFFITDGRTKKRTKSEKTDSKKNNKYVCNECGKGYATSSNLSRHKQTHRSPDGEAAKQCPHCNKVYVSMPALSMHILTHALRHTCDICGKGFSRPWLLQGHKRSHSGEKPYGCAHCGKAFADRSNLRAHMQTHSSQKSFQCKRCHKSFALKSYLNKHYESSCLKEETMSLRAPSEA